MPHFVFKYDGPFYFFQAKLPTDSNNHSHCKTRALLEIWTAQDASLITLEASCDRTRARLPDGVATARSARGAAA